MEARSRAPVAARFAGSERIARVWRSPVLRGGGVRLARRGGLCWAQQWRLGFGAAWSRGGAWWLPLAVGEAGMAFGGVRVESGRATGCHQNSPRQCNELACVQCASKRDGRLRRVHVLCRRDDAERFHARPGHVSGRVSGVRGGQSGHARRARSHPRISTATSQLLRLARSAANSCAGHRDVTP